MQVRQYESNLLEALNRIPPLMRAGSGLGHQMRHDPTVYDGVRPVSWLLTQFVHKRTQMQLNLLRA